MATPAIQTLLTDAQQVLNLNSLSEVRATMAAALANANVGTPLNPNLTTQQLWNQFYLIVRQPESDIESIITNQLMKFLFAPPAPGGVGGNHEVIYNNNGVLAGDPKFLWEDALNRLDIDGSATITGDLTVDTSTLKVDSTNNRVGIGTASPAATVSALIGSEFLHFGFGANNDNYYTVGASGTHFWRSSSTEQMRLNASGLGVGVVPSAGKGALQLSSGINFPATQVASSDANTLDDYEEGSWVPTLNSGTFSSASCRFTKIGNMVTIFFDVTVGTGGGDRITNLPFAAASTSTVANGIYTNNQTYAAGTTAPVVVVGGSSSTLFFRTVGTGVAFSAMTLTAAANLTGSISYFV